MYVYDDAQLNVLDEALPFQMDHKSRGIRQKRMNLKCKVMICGFSQVGSNSFQNLCFL
jgi:hypothetical protein